MAVNVATLIAKLKMDTNHLERGAKRANKSLKKMRGGTDLVAKGLRGMGPAALFGATAAGAAVTAFAVSSLKDFASFDKGMREVFTLLPNITGPAMKKMTQQTKDLAEEMGILPDKVVPALYQAISKGVPQENVFDFMKIASKAAIGGVTDLETTVDGLTSVVNAFGKENITTQKAADLMFTAVRLGKTTFEELSRFMFQVNPIAAGLGIEFSNVTAALAALTAQGVPTRVAATQTRQALVELGKGGTIAFKAFKKLTGESFVEFIAGGGTVKQAFDIMKAGADDLNVGVGDLFGSVEAGMAVIALTTKGGMEAFGNAMSEGQDSAREMEAAFETMDEGLARSMEKLQAQIALMKIELGKELAPTMLKLVATTLAVVKGMDDWFLGAGLVAQGVNKLGSRIMDFINLGLTDFWDDTDEALFQFTKTAGFANQRLREGADAANVAADWMAHLALKTAITERTWEAMRLTTGLTAGEMDKAARRVIENADAWGLNADQVARLNKFLGFFRDGVPGVIGRIEDWALRTRGVAAATDGATGSVQELTDLLSGDAAKTVEEFAADFKEWELEISKAAGEAELALRNSMGSIIDLFSGAPKKIKISVDKMIANILEQKIVAKEFEKAMRLLMAAGLDAVVDELEKAGPAAVDQAVALAADINRGFELELELQSILGGNIARLEQERATLAARLKLLGMTLGEAFAAGFNIRALLVPGPLPGAPPRGGEDLDPFERRDFHGGGVVPGPRGKEVAATLLGGETVIPLGGAGGTTIGEMHVTLQGTFDQSDPSSARRFAVQMREELEALNAEVA